MPFFSTAKFFEEKVKSHPPKSYKHLSKIGQLRIPACLTLLFLTIIANPAYSAQKDGPANEQKKILKMDLRQLMQMNVTVTSVSKKPQKLHQTASAVYVITQEDIRRTGAVNLMEALRIAPGVQVSKINQNKYAVSIRGFNRGTGSDKLLVLMDGRSVYSPADSGVFWLATDTMLEDIDRIEVIRGPGAALWGSNAVAGVINIITKSAQETQDNLLSAGAGTEERGFGSYRYGAKIGDDFFYRVYGKYRDRDGGELLSGADAFDKKELGQIGFRGDGQLTTRDHLTVQGDTYYLDSELNFKNRFVSIGDGSLEFKDNLVQRGSNVLARWTRELENSSAFKLQIYYDRFERKSQVPINNTVEKADLDFQYDFMLGERQNLSWGFNYQYQGYNFEDTNIISVSENSAHLLGVFIHDEISLIPDKLNLILGSKFEYNEFSGFEFQPNIRTVWTPHQNHTLWTGFSRAVRIPNVREEVATVNRAVIPQAGLDILLREENDGSTNAEELLAVEMGYRFKYQSKFYFDLTSYYFKYNDLIEVLEGNIFSETSPSPAHLVLPTKFSNALKGDVYGVEVSGQWEVFNYWRLAGSYTFTTLDLVKTKDQATNSTDLDANGEPEHWFNLRSYLNLPHQFELDSMYYYVSRNFARGVPAYHRLDLRLGWRPTANVELSLVGQNLTDSKHVELKELLEETSQTERSFYLKATLNF